LGSIQTWGTLVRDRIKEEEELTYCTGENSKKNILQFPPLIAAKKDPILSGHGKKDPDNRGGPSKELLSAY